MIGRALRACGYRVKLTLNLERGENHAILLRSYPQE